MTDWAATGQMIGGIGTAAGSIAIVVAAILGRSAVKDFRHQKVIEKQVEQAERALAVAYKLKDAISAIRSPMTMGHESANAREELNKNDWFNALNATEQEKYVQANVFYQRTRMHNGTFDAAFEILPYVKAYFGKNIEDAFREILKNGRSVRIYADAYAWDNGLDRKFTEKIESIIWEGANVDGVDPISKEIEVAIEKIEAILLPKIQIEK